MIDDGRANANNTKVQHDDDDFNRLWVNYGFEVISCDDDVWEEFGVVRVFLS